MNDDVKQITAQYSLEWLGHKNQIDKSNIRSVPVLTSTVSIVDSACDLSVVIDSRLTMSGISVW